MSADDLLDLFPAIVILATLVAHFYYVVGAIYRRRWGFVAKIVGSFGLYLLVVVVSFLFGVGLCAAGCPSGLNFLLGLLYLAMAIALVSRLRTAYRRLIQDSTPTHAS